MRVQLRFPQPITMPQGYVQIVRKNWKDQWGNTYPEYLDADLTGLTATVLGVIEPPAARRLADTPMVLLLCDELLQTIDRKRTYALIVLPDDLMPLGDVKEQK